MKKKLFIPVLAIGLLLGTVSFKNDFFEIAKQLEIFTSLFKELHLNYVDQTNAAHLMDTAIKSMLNELDPYTQYLNEQDVEGFKINATGEYSGIGAMVQQREGKLIIVEPYKGYAADKAGLKAGDEIIQIDDVILSEVEDNASELLKGAKKSEISLIYKRQGTTHTAVLQREEIEIDAVPYSKMINEKTGYIVLSRFNNKAAEQTKEALESLKSQGAESLVLDLRDNPGGLLTEAIAICNLFVPKDQLIVSTKSKVQKFNAEYRTKKNPVDTQMPLVVLINEKSASASEIVSGALQDLDRAVIVGTKSFGKGLVQRPVKLKYGTQLKVTISRYYTPSGRCIQALDYWHRDENGKAVKPQEIHEFTTKNGRKVYDGGGVHPDLEVAQLNQHQLLKSLSDKQLIFDFATDYYYRHPEVNLENFKLNNTAYKEFINYIKGADIHFETSTETRLKKLLASKEITDLGPSVETNAKALLQEISNSKFDMLENNQEALLKQLQDELVLRYGYREGLYQYNLHHDQAIQMATALFNEPSKYKGLLH